MGSIRAWLFVSGFLLLSGCSVDILKVPATWVNSAKLAETPLMRGDSAPGAFKYVWSFKEAKGYLIDPSLLAFDSTSEIKGVHLRSEAGVKQAVLIAPMGPGFRALDGFRETISGPGEIIRLSYQLSNDGVHWFYHDGKAWNSAAASIISQSNSASEVNAHAAHFHTEAGSGMLQLRVFFTAQAKAEASNQRTQLLQSIEVRGVAPRTDGWD